jgi:hypothetical protein
MNEQNNENIYPKSNSIVLDLETLGAKYRNLLIEYQQAVANYVNYLKDYNIEEKQMSSIKGSAFWGTIAIGENNSASLQECQASCANTNGCTGSTFNPSDHEQPMCWLRGGTGDVVSGIENDYAIIPIGKKLLSIVQSINQQLTSINKQIQEKNTIGQTIYNSQQPQRGLKTIELINQFVQLTQERDNISKMLNEYKTLDQEQTEGNIMINQNYYSFILLLGLVIVILFILYKIGLPLEKQINYSLLQSGGQLGINAYYIIFGIILLLLFFKFIFV